MNDLNAQEKQTLQGAVQEADVIATQEQSANGHG